MSSTFSAGPQSLGYHHQTRHALLALLRARREDAVVFIEGLDDVVVQTSGTLDLDQLKHHVRREASLTDSSADLWKPLRVWAETVDDVDLDATRLNLITTASAPEGSAASLLRGKNRDVETACTRLDAVARTSANQALQPAFKAYLNLDEPARRRLLNAVTVRDQAPTIDEVVPLIEAEVRQAVRREFVEPVRERLEGWWFENAVQHLIGESDRPITRLELLDKLHAITDDYKRDQLSLEYVDAQPDTEPDPDADDRPFVQQLRTLSLGATSIRYAIIDYYRAYEQRSKWAREYLQIDPEIERYERRLVEAWERYVALWEDEKGETDDDHVRFGKRVYRWVNADADIPIRDGMPSTLNRPGFVGGSHP